MGIFVSSGLFTLALLPNFGCCSERTYDIFLFITPILYFSSIIASYVYIFLHSDCINIYKNSDDNNIIKFYHVIIWNNIVSAIIFMLMLISFLITQCCNFCKKQPELPINNPINPINNSNNSNNSDDDTPLIILD